MNKFLKLFYMGRLGLNAQIFLNISLILGFLIFFINFVKYISKYIFVCIIIIQVYVYFY